jgi:hypothetical protein
VVDGLAPKMLGQSTVVKYSACALQESPIERFRYSVVLWGVMGGESMFRSLLLEELAEFFASILPSTIGTKSFDLRAVLGLCPGREVLVGLQGLVLRPQKLDTSIA